MAATTHGTHEEPKNGFARRTSLPPALWIVLALTGLILIAVTVPGIFTIDEDNYLVNVVALRHGRLSLPGTEGLAPSPELRYFDPRAPYAASFATPVASTSPPLYGPLALPFSLFGLRGLIALNTFAFLATCAMVFIYARDYSEDELAGWLALALFALGSYCLEYALGLWPHMLAVALTTGTMLLAGRLRAGAHPATAIGAGLLIGLAAGLRYQNILFAACVGLGIFIWSRRRWMASLLYSCGLAPPLILASFINMLRAGAANPVSKGPGYLALDPANDARGALIADWARMLMARLVDYSWRPPFVRLDNYDLVPDPGSGAFLILGAVKKAWLQSSPWIALGAIALVLAWLGRGALGPARRRELRAISLIVVPVVLLFAVAGSGRSDGLCFNQRYLLELTPLAAVAVAWLVALRYRLGIGAALGLAAGGAAAIFVLLLPASSLLRPLLLLRLPLILAGAVVLAWAWQQRRPVSWLLSTTLAACIGWSYAVHICDDLRASRHQRTKNLLILDVLDRALPEHSALFAYRGHKDAAGPLQLRRDVVIVDPWADNGVDAPLLVRQLHDHGRRIFVLDRGFPRPILNSMAGKTPPHHVAGSTLPLVEILPP